MRIEKANKKDAAEVYALIKESILAVYPSYYSPAVTAWFGNDAHSLGKVASDIAAGCVYVLRGARICGTVTVREDHIEGLFVLPGFGCRGFGSELLRFAEALIAEKFRVARLESSAPAERFYRERGYQTVREETAQVFGETLRYPCMEKEIV